MKKILLSLLAIMTFGLTAGAQQKNGKILVAYVSMTGTTAKAAKALASVTGARSMRLHPQSVIQVPTWTGGTRSRAAMWRCTTASCAPP